MALVFRRGNRHEKKPTLGSLDDSVNALQDGTLQYLKTVLPHTDAFIVWNAGQKIHDLGERAQYYAHIIDHLHQRGSPNYDSFATFKTSPVGVREFVTSPHYLNKEKELYPAVMTELEELNSGRYVEAVLTGGIGSGKTTLALYTNAYQLYLLSCMRSPHKLFGLDPSSEILLIFQSITKQLAKGLDYQRFRDMLEGSPYFQKYYPFRRDLESRLVFENRIEVVPVAGTETAAIGQNVIGGLIDELNYMAVVEKSKVSVDKGTYDQAVAVYNSIARRRKSRFMKNGMLPGILCLVSSKKYPGQFTDQKMEEAKRDSTIFVYDKRMWEIRPNDFGQQGYFNVFIGDLSRKPRILQEDEQDTLSAEDRETLIATIPNELREDFNKDIINALREVAGISTLARHPFFLEVEKVHASFKQNRPSIFSQSPVDFVTTRLTLIKRAFFKPDLPRFAHIDLAVTGDSAGLCIGTVDEFRQVSSASGQPAYMPRIWIDGVLEIRPPKNGEILFSKIRDVIKSLREMGLNIRWVTFDTYQSTDSQQILRQWGLITGPQSMDTMPCIPYDFLKSAVYEGRVSMPAHPHLQREILMLEKDTKTGKVDHPPGGSKDCADALAGVAYGLTMRRELWGIHRIPIMMMPENVYTGKDKLKSDEQTSSEFATTDELYRLRRSQHEAPDV